MDPLLTDDVDSATDDDGPFATNEVCNITSDESAEEGTTRQDRDDQRLRGTGESDVLGIERRALDGVDEVDVTIDTVDVPRVISEEDTTEGRKGADQIGFPGDGSFDAINIARGSERDAAARHGCCLLLLLAIR